MSGNMLGELYFPTGKAKETAQQVLEVDKPMACNVSWNCTNCCRYCFIPYTKKGEIRLPKHNPRDLVFNQLSNGLKPEGVFLSFATDPFIDINKQKSAELIHLLTIAKNIRVATLSKVGLIDADIYKFKVRNGMTIVSDNEEFRKKFEPNASSINHRIQSLKIASNVGCYTWVSLEPFPTPKIFEQNIEELLSKIDFVDFIIFGKWNYDARANDKIFYSESVNKFNKYCSEVGIRHFVKSDTLKFIEVNK